MDTRQLPARADDTSRSEERAQWRSPEETRKRRSAILRGLREAVGPEMTQKQLSAISGVSSSHISRIESGDRDLTYDVALALAPHLGDPMRILQALDFEYAPAAHPILSRPLPPLQVVDEAIRSGGWPDMLRRHIIGILEAWPRQEQPTVSPG